MAIGNLFHSRIKSGFLYKANPLTKLILLIIISIILSASNNYLVFGLSILLILTSLLIKLPILKYLKEGFVLIIIAFFILITEWLNTKDLLLTSLATLKFLMILLSSLILLDTTNIDDLSRSLSAFLHPIFGRFAYRFSAIIELTLSMFPLIIDTAITTKEAREARFESFLKRPIKSITNYSISLLSNLLDSVSDYSDALISRGYDVYAKRERPKFSYIDLILFFLGALLLAGFYVAR